MTLKPEDIDGGPGGMTLGEWLDVTLTLEREGFGIDPVNLPPDEKANWWTQMLFAAVCETVEMGDELGWKAWSKPRGWANREAAISEAADALHFIGLALASIECTGDEITAAYLRKVQKNYDRQAKGDDVRGRRCLGCGRSLDDVGIQLRPDEWDSGNRVTHTRPVCAACGEAVPRGS